jgi:hypothetical protein
MNLLDVVYRHTELTALTNRTESINGIKPEYWRPELSVLRD